MTRVQEVIIQALSRGHIHDDELLLQALLWRGFLAFRDETGVWLGTGSHKDDVRLLQGFWSVEVYQPPIGEAKVGRLCGVLPRPGVENVGCLVLEIVGFPGALQNGFTSTGVTPFLRGNWRTYREMKWGARLPVSSRSGGILDTGIALLVKALPLARIATSYSCDGHGEGPAQVKFFFRWDAYWWRSVSARLGGQPAASIWKVTRQESGPGALEIEPSSLQSDEDLYAFLQDIQTFARSLLHSERIRCLGDARARVLGVFANVGDHGPSGDDFSAVAEHVLDSMGCLERPDKMR